MTNPEAIEILKKDGWGYPENMRTEAVMMAIDALERQIPMKPFKLSPLSEDYFCPYCDSLRYDKWIGKKISALCQVNMGDRYCTCCGQAIDWSEVNDE